MWHIIPESFRTNWKDWEVRFLVLFSLLLQIILIPAGTHRMATQRVYILVLVWIAYLTAESIPILTLGVISNWLSNLKDESTTGTVERKYELFALWAPIVLVHLGGPDSITAYALADNELWLRHFARVFVQIGWTCYIYFLALSSSALSYIAIGIIIIGILKNFERTLSLLYSSKDEFRNSLISPPRSSLLYARLSESISLRKEEGHIVTLKGVTETEASAALSAPKYHILEKPQDRNAYIAFKLLGVFEVLFADLSVNLKALGNIKSLFAKDMTSENAFKIIDIELNLMFESLYTKARIVYKTGGKISKAIALVLSIGVLVSFCLLDKRVYELKIDVSITSIVISFVLLSEIYAIIKASTSDRTYALAIELKSSFWYRLISYIQSRRRLGWLGFTTQDCRWSNNIIQSSILGLAIKQTPRVFTLVDMIRTQYEKAIQYICVTNQPLGDNLRGWIHSYLKEKVMELEQEGHPDDSRRTPWLLSYGAAQILEKRQLGDLIWSTPENNFSQSIVVWHIATEILYYKYRSKIKDGEVQSKCEISRTLSKYLMYLLVQKPAMLPIGVGDNYHAHTLLEARKYFESQLPRIPSYKSHILSDIIGLKKKCQHKDDAFRCENDADPPTAQKRQHNISEGKDLHDNGEHESLEELDICRICHMLLEVPHEEGIKPELAEGEGNKSVLFQASHLASQINKSPIDLKAQWDVVATVWTEALLYAAYHTTGDVHAKQLSCGGELLTHVWLLMAHFGISKQVKASTTQALKRMVQT